MLLLVSASSHIKFNTIRGLHSEALLFFWACNLYLTLPEYCMDVHRDRSVLVSGCQPANKLACIFISNEVQCFLGKDSTSACSLLVLSIVSMICHLDILYQTTAASSAWYAIFMTALAILLGCLNRLLSGKPLAFACKMFKLLSQMTMSNTNPFKTVERISRNPMLPTNYVNSMRTRSSFYMTCSTPCCKTLVTDKK